MSPFHFCLSAAKNLSSFQLLPASLITDLLQLFLGRPLFLFPWGFQSRAAFVISPFSFLNVWPIHLNFLFLISTYISSCPVTFHRSFLKIIFGHHILNIYLRHLFTKVCILRWISFVTPLFKYPYLYGNNKVSIIRKLYLLFSPGPISKWSVDKATPKLLDYLNRCSSYRNDAIQRTQAQLKGIAYSVLLTSIIVFNFANYLPLRIFPSTVSRVHYENTLSLLSCLIHKYLQNLKLSSVCPNKTWLSANNANFSISDTNLKYVLSWSWATC